MKRRRILITLIFASMIYGCKPTLYIPESSNADQQEHLLKGRKLYVNHCSSCHNLHFPGEYDTEGWEIQLEKMEYRARISDQEKQLIYDYLTFKK